MLRSASITTAALGLLLLAPPLSGEVQGCTCLPTPGIEHVFADAEHVLRVSIRQEVRRIGRLRGLPNVDHGLRGYRARVKQSYKGCLRRGRIIKLVTAKDSGLCGATLDRRREYVIALDGGNERNVYEINACQFLRPTDSLRPEEREFLKSREQCCDGRCRCAGEDRVACLVDPCAQETCGDATCVANFCGACRAEFVSAGGQPVCTPCEGDFDCGRDQVCEGGECRADVGCETDADCASDAWCRPTATGGTRCTPFVGEGATCQGLLPPWDVDLCGPGLRCDREPTDPDLPITPDLPGECVQEVP